jgi:hypothetical protein
MKIYNHRSQTQTATAVKIHTGCEQHFKRLQNRDREKSLGTYKTNSFYMNPVAVAELLLCV